MAYSKLAITDVQQGYNKNNHHLITSTLWGAALLVLPKESIEAVR
jgi:hypothetical protein